MRFWNHSHRSTLLSTALLMGLSGLVFAPMACGGTSETAGTGGSGNRGGGGDGGKGGAGAQGGDGGTGGEQLNCVIDGKKSDTEECDDGNDIPGDGCDPDCTFSCVNDKGCDDGDPCNGPETCTPEHTCDPGEKLSDGTSCDTGKICQNGVCLDDVCGDLFVSANEQCDDGNLDAGDGCDPDCTFSCTKDDPSKCAPADECAGVGECDDATNTCLPLVPLPDGTACMAGFCLNGVCLNAQCGNGNLDPGEDCDDGNAINGDGCDIGCVFSCVDPVADCLMAPLCQMATCTAQHTCANAPDPAQEGMACGGVPGFSCKNGACASDTAMCGNSVVEPGEDCDFGMANGPGTGCEMNCTFSCTTMPDSCNDNNPCNGMETCTQVMVGLGIGQQCQPGMPAADCTACPGGLCGSGMCNASTCGDGCIDPGTGEQCEPPGSPMCSATCQSQVVAVCGNGMREGAEQCDDGNTANMDGCDSACKFEQDHRVNWLQMQFATDAYCTANKLGGAFTGGIAQSQVQQSLDTGVADGSINVLFKMMNLDDLTGTSDPMVGIGFVNADPETMGGTLMYDGTADLDWWYLLDPTSVDANNDPLTVFPGNIAAKVMTGGPGTVNLNLVLAGVVAPLKMSQATVTGTIGATSMPLMSMGLPPGHLSGENIDPALVSFATVGQPNANGAAKLCGNVSAASLALVPIPPALTGGGLTACSQNYSTNNSLLDLIVGGCNILFGVQITPTQPDKVDPAVMQPGAGGPYVLSANGATKMVSSCVDMNGAMVPLQECLEAAAYSSFFKFTTDRVIIK